MKKHKKLELKEPVDEISNREKAAMIFLVLVSLFLASGVIAFIIATVKVGINGTN